MSKMTLKKLQKIYPFEQTGYCVRHAHWVIGTSQTQENIWCPMCSQEKSGKAADRTELRDRIVWALAQWIIEETVSGDRDRFDGLRGAELVLSALGEKKPTDA